MALATEHRCRFVTLVPQTVSLRQEVVDAPGREVLPLWWERPGRRKGECASYQGTAVVRPYHWKTAAGERQEWPWRVLVVESTPRAKATAPRLTAAQQAAWAMLTALQQQWQRRTFACEADARQAATLHVRELAWPDHHLTDTGDAEWVPAKRATRGRPFKDALRPQRQVWRVSWQVQEATAAIVAQAPRERRFVLATNVLETQHLSDADWKRPRGLRCWAVCT
jgi:hypothetical protein